MVTKYEKREKEMSGNGGVNFEDVYTKSNKAVP